MNLITRSRRPLRLVFLATAAACSGGAWAAEPWQPFPPALTFNDFGDIGLFQTPTARFAPDGQMALGANHVWPYDRYYFTVQGLPWLEATLRLTTVRNRLYSPFPEFSGTQSYKDRGFDVKIRVFEESGWRPGVALGLRDFLGTGLFSSEYVVANKAFGPLDVSVGLGWGNIGARGGIPNPFRLISGKFDDRGKGTAGGGSLNASYFKGREVGIFGGVKYETPLRGLTLKGEYDSNNYKNEALSNRFRVRLPVNVGAEYELRSWLHVNASLERGNQVGVSVTATTNFNRPFRIPKFDYPGAPVTELAGPDRPTTTAKKDIEAPPVPLPETSSAPPKPAAATELKPIAVWSSDPSISPTATAPAIASTDAEPDTLETPALIQEQLGKRVINALNRQGAGLYAADFQEREVTLYVAQSRFQSMPKGLGRIARAAFSVLPSQYEAVRVVFVENGLETISARVYRAALIEVLTPGRGSPAELLRKVDFAEPPLALDRASYQGPLATARPRVFYSLRPFLKTTLGRPEQFILYQTGIRLNGFAQINRNLNIQGSVALNLSDNFDKMQIPSNSTLPHVRSDIKDYLREGKTSLSWLHANYTFNLTPSLYGHVFGGLLEEMYGGVGGELLWRPTLSNWAVGADLSWVKKRDFDQRFDFLNYSTVTGFVTIARYIPEADIDVRVRLGRYLAKDYGGTLEIARTFGSGVVIGAFATKTNVSAADFGEGRFDKGIYISIPLDAIYNRHVRGTIGLLYRPLIRDGGQALAVPQPLLFTTDSTLRSKFRRDWSDIDK